STCEILDAILGAGELSGGNGNHYVMEVAKVSEAEASHNGGSSCQSKQLWPTSLVSPVSLKRRRRTCAHDLAGLIADIAEPMRDRARKVIRITGVEDPNLSADGQLDLPRDDDTALFAFVTQHVSACIGFRAIP